MFLYVFWAFLFPCSSVVAAHRAESEPMNLELPIQLHRGQPHDAQENVWTVPPQLAESSLQGMSVHAHQESLEEHEAEGPVSSSATGGSSFLDVPEMPKDLSKVECPGGVLTLRGSYELKKRKGFKCSKIIAHDAFLALGKTLTLDTQIVEFTGSLSLWATAEGFGCLEVTGTLIVNFGSLSIRDCKNKGKPSIKGGAIKSKAFWQQGGNTSITNCSAEGTLQGTGGAIYTQTGGTHHPERSAPPPLAGANIFCNGSTRQQISCDCWSNSESDGRYISTSDLSPLDARCFVTSALFNLVQSQFTPGIIRNLLSQSPLSAQPILGNGSAFQISRDCWSKGQRDGRYPLVALRIAGLAL